MRLVARRVPLSAIAWPYRWLFALTECGEQRSPAARLCACSRARAHSRARTQPRVYGCVPKPLSILSMRRRRIATYSGHARGEEFRGGGRIVNCYEVDFGPEIP
ncbi:unnamed protein product, partial [Brenthis ino]